MPGRVLLIALGAIAATPSLHGQEPALPRLSPDVLDILPPSSRVSGAPGRMRIEQTACNDTSVVNLRRRIVDIAIQEWGFFGFTIVDQTKLVERKPRVRPPRRRTPWLNPEESARVADSIAGYWAVTGDGRWILSRQNDVWLGPSGVAARWRDPWSAAFVSWVMCEGGLGDEAVFRRAIAHHTYIDQAIEARDSGAARPAFAAYDIGEQVIDPGDLLCTARRPAYATIAERRRELGTGIRSHCDIVVRVDAKRERILAIGGNVRGAVSLKLLAARFETDDVENPAVTSVGRGSRAAFAHLKLRAPSLAEDDAIASSPTLRALGRQGAARTRLLDKLDDRAGQACCLLPAASAAAALR
jgi:hypothetical protein